MLDYTGSKPDTKCPSSWFQKRTKNWGPSIPHDTADHRRLPPEKEYRRNLCWLATGLRQGMDKNIGIHGNLYKWIKNVLSDRIIQSKVHNTFSSKCVLEEGLPQGSSLSCTLFLIFLNDLPKILKSEKAQFADDLAFWQTQNKAGTCAILLNDLQRLDSY